MVDGASGRNGGHVLLLVALEFRRETVRVLTLIPTDLETIASEIQVTIEFV